jgi:hypothetical protein
MNAAIAKGVDATWAPAGSVVSACSIGGVDCVLVESDDPGLYRAAMLAGTPGERLCIGFGSAEDLVAEHLGGRHPGYVEVRASRLLELEATVANQAAELLTLRAAAAAVVASKRPE